MNKREMIHALIDRLLDIEESSNKRVFFSYYGHCNGLDLHVVKNEKAFTESLGKRSSITFDRYYTAEQFKESLVNIEIAKNIEDAPVEDVVSIKLSESRARELGLIA